MKLKPLIGLVIFSCMLSSDVLSEHSAAVNTNATVHVATMHHATRMFTEPVTVLRRPMDTTIRPGPKQIIDELPKEAFVVITIRDAECYSAHTESSFVVYLAALDFNNVHTSSVYIRSDKFVYNNITNTRTFSGKLMIDKQYDTLDECFQNGLMDCVPRADVVYIRFESEPDDPWAIDQIDVDVTFQLEQGSDARYTWHFEHAILLPCSSWIEERSVYQIGPRVGLFIKQSYQFNPRPGFLARAWV